MFNKNHKCALWFFFVTFTTSGYCEDSFLFVDAQTSVHLGAFAPQGARAIGVRMRAGDRLSVAELPRSMFRKQTLDVDVPELWKVRIPIDELNPQVSYHLENPYTGQRNAMGLVTTQVNLPVTVFPLDITTVTISETEKEVAGSIRLSINISSASLLPPGTYYASVTTTIITQ